ncbi:glycoside hydrolase family 3 protein [Marinicellulosiphila megalodicopiae]|uniref:glycoside hydrolase family 3 protein n=1 Tax=Marinicellulosiphila megalodicopiae TaxID=2724896 RepID=UPI003BAFF3F0
MSHNRFSIKVTDYVKQIAQTLTVREQIAEICCAHYGSHNLDQMVPAGSVFIHPGPKDYFKGAMDQFNSLCKYPALMTTDMEEGPGLMIKGGTKFPSMAGCAATDSLDNAYTMGKIAGIEGRQVGFNWTLAPCVDINHVPDTPTCTTRTAGQTAEKVIGITSQYIKGCQENGLMATAKHFPGDGFGVYDQHLTTPENPHTMERWWATSGKVYQTLIDEGVMTIMPGHISLPAYDEVDPSNGVYPPACQSKKIMTDLLKGELNFDGLIVSDAINMGGFAGFRNIYDGCAMFLEGGGDVLLFANPTESFLDEIEARIDTGLLTKATLLNRVERVLGLKEQLGLIGQTQDTVFTQIPLVDLEAHQKVADAVIGDAIRLVRDRNSVLPVTDTKSKKVLHVTVLVESIDDAEAKTIIDLNAQLEKEFASVTHMDDPGPNKLLEIVQNKEYDLIICSLGNSYKYGTNVIRLYGKVARNMMSGWMHMGTEVVFISHFHHRTHEEYVAVMDCVINTYGTMDRTHSMLVDRIVGKTDILSL